MKIINKSILTIGIPVYNGGSDLKRLLDSIFSQNFDRELVEIIISNNASEDDTRKISNSYKIKYYENNENIGADKNILKVVELASSKYVWVIGHDDILALNSINLVLDSIRKFTPNSIFCNYSLIDKNKSNLRKKWINSFENKMYNNINELSLDVGISTNFISAIIHNKEGFLGSNPKNFFGTNWIQLSSFLYYSRNNTILFISDPLIINAGNSEKGEGNLNGKSLRILLNLKESFDKHLTCIDAKKRIQYDFEKYSIKKLISVKRLGYDVPKKIIDSYNIELKNSKIIKLLFNFICIVDSRFFQILYKTKFGLFFKKLMWKKL